MSEFQPQLYGPKQATLQPWNPLDHLRLLWWVFFVPGRLTTYRRKHGQESTRPIGTWLASTLLWIPLLIPILAVGLHTLPVGSELVPLWLLIAGMVLGWLLTAWMGSLEYPMAAGWREAFGPVYEGAFIVVFGLAFGVAFGTAFLTGLDIMEILLVNQALGQAGLGAMVAAFGIAFGIAYIVADKVAFGGAFIITPLLAMCFTGLVAFGIGFVGNFIAIFLMAFGIVFVISFVVAFVLVSLIASRIERYPDSALARGVRIVGLVALASAHAALLWICFFEGWRLLLAA